MNFQHKLLTSEKARDHSVEIAAKIEYTKVLAWYNHPIYANQRNTVILITSHCNYAMMEMIGT